MILSTLVLEVRNGVVGVAIVAAVVDAIVGSVVVVVFVFDAVVVVVVVFVVGVDAAFEVGDSNYNNSNDNNNSNYGKADDVFACALVEGSSVVETIHPFGIGRVSWTIYLSSQDLPIF